METVTSHRCEIFQLGKRDDSVDLILFSITFLKTPTAPTQHQFRRLNPQKQHDCWAVWNTRALFHKSDKEKWVTVRDGEGKRLALMSIFSGHAKGNNLKTGDRDGSHLWSVVINWPWSLLCPVISSWCRRWKGFAIYQHLRVNLSRPQRLGAAQAGADYQGTTPTAHIFYQHIVTLIHTAMPAYNCSKSFQQHGRIFKNNYYSINYIVPCISF